MTDPRLHVPRHVSRDVVHTIVHGEGLAGRFNTWLAIKITNSVGTMWCAYLFTVIALLGLPQAVHDAFDGGGPLPVVQWVAQTFLQLVLLSVILVGQRVISEAQDARALADHDTLTALQALNVQQMAILEELKKLQGHA